MGFTDAPPTAPPTATPPPYNYPVAMVRSTNGLAVASLVLGILFLFGVGSVLALIFGLVARRQIRRAGGTQAGDGLAVAGITLGAVGICAGLLLSVAVMAAGSSSSGTKASVCRTDATTIAIGEEALFAATGRYGSMSELVAAGYLRAAPDGLDVSPAAGSYTVRVTDSRCGTVGDTIDNP